MILGVINSVDSLNGLKVVIDGESSPSTKKYCYLASYVPAANDRVLIEEVNGSYVILGKLCTEVANCGIVRQATNATNATTAASCSGNAATATTAASCSGNAATATSAAKCTGNAATATVSNTTKGFDTSVQSDLGSLVTSVTRTWNATISSYIVTDVSTTYQNNYVHK